MRGSSPRMTTWLVPIRAQQPITVRSIALRLLPACLLPDEIVTARMAELADTCRAVALYAAADAQVDRLGAPTAGRFRSHRQLALGPDGSSELVASGGGIPCPAVRDVE